MSQQLSLKYNVQQCLVDSSTPGVLYIGHLEQNTTSDNTRREPRRETNIWKQGTPDVYKTPWNDPSSFSTLKWSARLISRARENAVTIILSWQWHSKVFESGAQRKIWHCVPTAAAKSPTLRRCIQAGHERIVILKGDGWHSLQRTCLWALISTRF